MATPWLDDATTLFPDGFFSSDPSDRGEYGKDWTRVYPPDPAAIAFPRTTDEVARLLRFCSERGVAVVPSGGRTGLAGGAMATHGELVLSLSRMRRMDPVDLLGSTVRVEAGAVTQAVHEHCERHGLTWPVDFASKGSSTVGGNIATNAGGVKVIRYGLTRQWVLGLRVVLVSGEVLELGGALEKNNTGVDLRQLFIGSEGTLGIITEATLKLTRLPPEATVMLFAVRDLAAVLALFRDVRTSGITLSAYEFFTRECLERLLRHRRVRDPFDAPSGCYVLVEADRGAAVDAWVEGALARGLVTDGTIAQHASQAAELWELREGISESLSATGLPHKNDIALPIARLEAFTTELVDLFAREYPGWEVCVFGHVGDGNLHVNVMKPDAMPKEEFLAKTSGADHAMFDLVRKHAGSISAEHGIGLLKKPYLHYSRSPEELSVMRSLKRALDPKNLLNPGKVLDP
jgi:FAD/FMN-containing dehydrogenase